jgi:hypothetical protein
MDKELDDLESPIYTRPMKKTTSISIYGVWRELVHFDRALDVVGVAVLDGMYQLLDSDGLGLGRRVRVGVALAAGRLCLLHGGQGSREGMNREGERSDLLGSSVTKPDLEKRFLLG